MLLHSSLFKPLLLDHAVANELHSIFQRKLYLTNPALLQDPMTSNAVIDIHSRGNGQPGLFLDTKFQQYLPITVPIRTKHMYVRIISGATITKQQDPRQLKKYQVPVLWRCWSRRTTGSNQGVIAPLDSTLNKALLVVPSAWVHCQRMKDTIVPAENSFPVH